MRIRAFFTWPLPSENPTLNLMMPLTLALTEHRERKTPMDKIKQVRCRIHDEDKLARLYEHTSKMVRTTLQTVRACMTFMMQPTSLPPS
jgi:hypothetical protein